ncbi:hypothetical protein M1D89_17310 [Arthrobacter sp. D3-18]
MAKTEHVEFSGWFFAGDGRDVQLHDELEHWDYQATLQVNSRLALIRADLLSWCELGSSTKLACLVTAKSDKTRVEMLLARVEIPITAESLNLKVAIPGQEMGGRLTITTSVVVLDAHPLSAVSARRPGSVLWSTRTHTHLQGVGSQFPTYAESFSERYPDFRDASWFLQIETSDLEASFLSSVRLFLNADKTQVRRLLAGSKDTATQLLRRTIDTDVTRQLVHCALNLTEVMDAEVDFDELDLLHGLRNILQMIWPATDAKQLWNDYKRTPWKIEAKIQAVRKLT